MAGLGMVALMLAALLLVALLVAMVGGGGRQTADSGVCQLILRVRDQEDAVEGLIWQLRRLQQRFRGMELMVVDEGSQDQTLRILQNLQGQPADFELIAEKWANMQDCDNLSIKYNKKNKI